MVIHFKPHKKYKFNIKELSNLEKITNILFSNRRKKINKNIKKILETNKMNQIRDLNTNLRPENLAPEIFYKITELYEMN